MAEELGVVVVAEAATWVADADSVVGDSSLAGVAVAAAVVAVAVHASAAVVQVVEAQGLGAAVVQVVEAQDLAAAVAQAVEVRTLAVAVVLVAASAAVVWAPVDPAARPLAAVGRAAGLLATLPVIPAAVGPDSLALRKEVALVSHPVWVERRGEVPSLAEVAVAD